MFLNIKVNNIIHVRACVCVWVYAFVCDLWVTSYLFGCYSNKIKKYCNIMMRFNSFTVIYYVIIVLICKITVLMEKIINCVFNQNYFKIHLNHKFNKQTSNYVQKIYWKSFHIINNILIRFYSFYWHVHFSRDQFTLILNLI